MPRALLIAALSGVIIAPPAMLAGESGPAAAVDGDEASADGPPSCCTLPSRFGARVEFTKPPQTPKLEVEATDFGVRVTIDGERFADYRVRDGHQPAVWPIFAASGRPMTRSWPIGERRPGEADDHPHHRSLWFAHGGVNGHDFWQESTDPDSPRIVHREFVSHGAPSGREAIVVAHNDWVGAGNVVLRDERTLVFGLLAPFPMAPRYVDMTVCLTAGDQDAVFADTKEGSFGVRVPGAMKVDAGLGGRIRSRDGRRDAEAWGRVAPWVDYSGPLEPASDDAPPANGGIVMMAHPEADLPACRWHVRAYGLFAANPFGVSDFPNPPPDPRPVTLPAGESITLRYRAVFYEGEYPLEGIGTWYEAFAATPLVSGHSATE